jgi:eukaryotic-like serine/threonine-protein kinase
VPLAGGAPRELLENVRGADWSPDGKSLAVTHVVNGKGMRLEYPIGKVLYEPPGWISQPRISPKGDLIAFVDVKTWLPGAVHEKELTVVDREGKRRGIIKIPAEFEWSPTGDEIWFNEVEGGTTSIRAVAMSGRKRLLASFPGDFVLQDVSRDGRVLLERAIEQHEIVGRFSGDPADRNLSWLDGSVPADVSADGKTLLFAENGQGGGPDHAVYKRRTDGSPAVRLGEGEPLALSPDGLWALCVPGVNASHLVLLPTGPGEARVVQLSGIRIFGSGASFFPDGKRILLRGAETGHGPRLYEFDIESGKARAITAEGVSINSSISLSPDGTRVVSSEDDGKAYLYDVAGGPPRPVPGISQGFYAIKWCGDECLFVRTSGINPLKVYRLDLTTGRLELWKELSVPDIGAGAVGVLPTPDGKSYVYGYTRYFSDLFIVEGLR